MLLVLDLEFDPGDRGREIAEQPDREIRRLALRARQRPDRQPRGEGADERAGGVDGARIIDPRRRAAAREPLPRPVPLVGYALQRSEARREGKEWVSTWRSWCAPKHNKKKKN